MTISRTSREAAVRWWVGPTCRLDEGVLAWCDGDDSVEVGHDVKRLADALDAAYARGVEDAERRLTRKPNADEYALARIEVATHTDVRRIDCVVSATEAKYVRFPVADVIAAQLRRAVSEMVIALAKGGPR